MTKVNNQENFLAMIQAHRGIIYKVANAYCSDTEARKDLVQEIIIQLWKSFDNYNSQYKHSTWIYRIALNTAISHYRKETSRKKLAAPLAEQMLYLAEDTDSREPDRQLQYLQQFIATLKPFDRALLLLYLEENPHAVIADIMGISVSNVATKIGRIKDILKQKFALIKN